METEAAPPLETPPAEEAPQSTGEEVVPKKLEIRHPGPQMSGAIKEIRRRVASRLRPCYREVSEKWGVKPQALNQMCLMDRKGQVEINEQDEQTLLVDKQYEMRRKLDMFEDLESLLNKVLEKQLASAKKRFGRHGETMSYRTFKIPQILADIKLLVSTRNLTEQGYMAILERANRVKKGKQYDAEIPAVRTPLTREEMKNRLEAEARAQADRDRRAERDATLADTAA